MGRMDVHGGTEDYDASFDDSFGGIDMGAIMDVDEDLKPKDPKEEPMTVKLGLDEKP